MTDNQSQPVYIMAEAGINHGGDLAVAARMVEAAAAAGVDAVKFQSFTAGGLASAARAPEQHAFFKQYELSREEHRELAALCARAGVAFLSTPFDFGMADLLAEIGVPAFKIASCDLTNLPLIEHVAAKGRPLYISTGMGDLGEARSAIKAALAAGCPRAVPLQCTTNYPTAYPDVHLRAMRALMDITGEAGFSDHSLGNYACFGAVALGARVIEKHFCLDKSAPGPDIACSCDPAELADLVRGIRAIEQALGDPRKQRLDSECEISTIARRSIFYVRDLPAGHRLSLSDLTFLRPGTGLSPARARELAGQTLARAVKAGDMAAEGDFGAQAWTA